MYRPWGITLNGDGSVDWQDLEEQGRGIVLQGGFSLLCLAIGPGGLASAEVALPTRNLCVAAPDWLLWDLVAL